MAAAGSESGAQWRERGERERGVSFGTSNLVDQDLKVSSMIELNRAIQCLVLSSRIWVGVRSHQESCSSMIIVDTWLLS